MADVTEPSAPAEPEFLTGDALDEWRRIVFQLADTLVDADHAILENYCETYAEVRMLRQHFRDSGVEARTGTGAQGQAITSPLYKALRDQTSELTRLATQLGLSPASRKRLPPPPKKPPARTVAPPLAEGDDPRKLLGG